MSSTTLEKNTGQAHVYAYDHLRFDHVMDDMFVSKNEPVPGDKVQDFDFPTTDGGHFTTADLKADGKPMLLIFGSNTCMVTESSAKGLKSLYARYGDKVRFIMIKSREAHPGEKIQQAHTFEEKFSQAVRLKEHHNFPFEMAVDDIDGTFHQSLDSRTNSVYIVDPSETILFHSQWGTEAAHIEKAIQAILAGKKPAHPFVSRTMMALFKTMGYSMPVFQAAGKGAYSETLRAFPPGAIMMRMADLFFFLPREKRGIPAMILTMSLSAAAVVGIIALITSL